MPKLNRKIELPKIFKKTSSIKVTYRKVRKRVRKFFKPLRKKENLKKVLGIVMIVLLALSTILPYVVSYIFK